MYHRTFIIVAALLFLCNLNYYACNGLLSTKSIRRVGHHTTNTLPLIQLNLFDNTNNNNNIFENLFSSSQQSKQQQWPKVEAPPNFITPEPRPLTVTESTDINGLVTASIALALRLATGAFVLGWQLDTILGYILFLFILFIVQRFVHSRKTKRFQHFCQYESREKFFCFPLLVPSRFLFVPAFFNPPLLTKFILWLVQAPC